MRVKTICLSILLLLALCSQFMPRAVAAADTEDWQLSGTAQWWWKYVVLGDGSVRVIDVSDVNVAAVRSDVKGYVAHQVTFTLTNKSRTAYKGGDAVSMEYFYDPEPSPWRPTLLYKALLPAVQAGASIRVTATAFTPSEGKFKNYVTLTVGK